MKHVTLFLLLTKKFNIYIFHIISIIIYTIIKYTSSSIDPLGISSSINLKFTYNVCNNFKL